MSTGILRGLLLLLLLLSGGRASLASASASLHRCPEAPLIDGQADAVWAEVPEWQLHNWRAGQPLLMETRARIMADDANLYFFVWCREVNLGEARTQERFGRHDAPVWNNGCVELFVDVKNDGRSYYQFVVDVHNGAADFWHFDPAAPQNPLDWNGYWQHAVGTYADGWTVEVAIPFASLDCPPGPLPYLGLNLSRVRRLAPFERSVLAPEANPLNATAKFLAYRDVARAIPAVLAEVEAGAAYIGRNVFRVRLRNQREVPLSGVVELTGRDQADGGERLREKAEVRLEANGSAELAIPYQVEAPGNLQMALTFVAGETRHFLQARNIMFRQVLEVNDLAPLGYAGEPRALYLRTYTAAASRELQVEIMGADGTCVARATYPQLAAEGFVRLPSAALPPGDYTVNLTLRHDASQSTSALPLKIINRL